MTGRQSLGMGWYTQSCRGRRMVRALILVGLSLIMAGSLSGCKYSDVLTQHREDPLYGVEDPQADPRYELDTDAAPDSRVLAVLGESDRQDDQELTRPDYEKESADSGEAKNATHDETPNQSQASEGTERSEGEGAAASDASEEDEGDAGTSQDESGDEEERDGSEGEGAAADDSKGRGGATGTYSATGSQIELPEDTACIAAAGHYATIVQMLGGAGGLVGCDAAWQEKVAAMGAFDGEGVEDLPVVFSGSEEKGYRVKVKTLVKAFAARLGEDQEGTLILDGATVSLSKEDLAALDKAAAEAGIVINCVTMPVLGLPETSEEELLGAVKSVAEMLKGSADVTLDVQDCSSSYSSFVEEAKSHCLSANGGKAAAKRIVGDSFAWWYQGDPQQTTPQGGFNADSLVTVFIDGWTSKVLPSVAEDPMQGYGDLASIGEGTSLAGGVGTSQTVGSRRFVLMDYYLQLAGVANASYPDAAPTVKDKGGSDPYLICAGAPSSYLGPRQGFSLLKFAYYSPLWHLRGDWGTDSTFVYPGCPEGVFPTVLVASEDIAEKTVAASKGSGPYAFGTAYDVAVVPAGLEGSWARGTVESFLLAPWALETVGAAPNSSAASDFIDAFYETFYRCKDVTASGQLEGYGVIESAGEQ